MRRAGFTLIEMLVAIMILSIMTIVSALVFSSVVNAWEKSVVMVDRMQTADYALGQIVAGLRSAYYPPTGEQKDEWGMALYDNGEGEDPGESDVLEWTKLGSAIIGNKSTLADTVHRVRIWVEEERSKDEPGGLWARVWNNDLDNAEANDRSVDEEPGEEFLLVEDVVGFDCVVQKDPKESDEDGRPKWEEEWATSNQIPFRVKLTFRMKPPEQGDEPLPLLRVVEIPLWDLSQNPISLDDKEKAAGARRGGQGGGQGGRPGPAGGGAGVAPGGRPGMPGTRPGGGVPGGMPGVGGGPGMGGPMR